jgi:hypothetical protein
MLYSLDCDVTIGELRFRTNVRDGKKRLGVHEVSIESTWDQLTDTATIQLPRKVYFQRRPLVNGANAWLKRGDKVSISLGYNGVITQVFSGYIDQIGIDTPVSIQCQDEMWLLKKGELSLSYKSVTLSKLIADVIGDKVPYEVVADVTLGAFRISKATPAKVLEYLREHYMLRSFFRGGVLYVGLAYVPKLQRKRKLYFDTHIPQHSLEWRERDSLSLLLKAVIIYPDNSKEEVEIGDKDGEQRTFHYYNIPKAEATKLLEGEIERLRYTGFRGSLTTFGHVDFAHGDAVQLVDPVYPERDGLYLIKKVSSLFGSGGYRQELELESRI